MPGNDATKRIITYLVLVFGISTIFYYLVIQNGGLEGGGEAYVIPLMWTPAVAGIITTFIFQRNIRGMGWSLGDLIEPVLRDPIDRSAVVQSDSSPVGDELRSQQGA